MIEQIHEYFKRLAAQNALIKHTPSQVRFMSMGIAEAVENVRTALDIKNLCLLCVYIERTSEMRNMDNFRKTYFFHLVFVRNCVQGNFADKLKAYQEAENAADQFISRMKYDMMQGNLCQIDIEHLRLLPIEKPLFDNAYGQLLEIPFVKQTDYEYNPSDWIV